MTTRDIHVVGSSAGGVQALQRLVSGLPEDLGAAVFVILHLASGSPSALPSILRKSSKLPVDRADDEMPIATGRVYVAPPDRHLVLEKDCMRLIHGPRENRHRPAIDVLFRSATWAFGPRVVGVVLTGMLDDGTSGLWAIRTCGGVTIVQDPLEAEFPQMPSSPLRQFAVDFRLPIAEIGPQLRTLARENINLAENGRERLQTENEFSKMHGTLDEMPQLGQPTVFTCPACNGSLWEIQDGGPLRYRCHVGHAFAAESLLAGQAEAMETALFTALRVMEEKAAAARRVAARYYGNSPSDRNRLQADAAELDERADVIRRMIAGLSPGGR